MKKYIYLILLIFLGFSINGQDINPLYKSLEKSNFQNLISHLDDPVELCINDEQDILDKKDAIVAIRGFFKRSKPISITQIHKGTSATKGSQYRVAKLNTENGQYRLFLYIERTRSGYVIKELRIDPEV
jgi:hypothetical protein